MRQSSNASARRMEATSTSCPIGGVSMYSGKRSDSVGARSSTETLCSKGRSLSRTSVILSPRHEVGSVQETLEGSVVVSDVLAFAEHGVEEPVHVVDDLAIPVQRVNERRLEAERTGSA